MLLFFDMSSLDLNEHFLVSKGFEKFPFNFVGSVKWLEEKINLTAFNKAWKASCRPNESWTPKYSPYDSLTMFDFSFLIRRVWCVKNLM